MKWTLLTCVVLAVYLQLASAGSDCFGLDDDQADKVKAILVTEKATPKLKGEFEALWAEESIETRLRCFEDTYEIKDKVVKKNIKAELKSGKKVKPPATVEMEETAPGVFDVKKNGEVEERMFVVHASDNVVAYICCDTIMEIQIMGPTDEESEMPAKKPKVRAFIKVRKGKKEDDKDVKDCVKAAKDKMDSLGTEITNELTMFTGSCSEK